MDHQLVVDKGSDQGTESALNDLRGGSGRHGQRTNPGDHRFNPRRRAYCIFVLVALDLAGSLHPLLALGYQINDVAIEHVDRLTDLCKIRAAVRVHVLRLRKRTRRPAGRPAAA
jgi:hypothetical protein